MTTATKPTSSPRVATPGGGRRLRRKGRTGIIAVLLIGLIFSGLLRAMSLNFQAANIGARGLGSSRGTLGNMNSYALALLLGGLRGPLVMFLWTTSESQKSDRDLDDLDTKIEWIRLLQPEFDTVHLFQMWNRAYNISVLMASPANKYSVIMEAIDYGRKVDQERPGDLNILQAIGAIYEGKLSARNLPESVFYMRQFREESLTDANRQKAFAADMKGYHRVSEMQPLLDENNDIRAELIAPVRSRSEHLSADRPYNDGSALQYLASYKHFPYGVPPQAMAYNYAKRAQIAMDTEGQKPLQLSPMVIDSQPGLLLKMWGEEETYRGHEMTARAYGIPLTENTQKNTQLLSELSLDRPMVDRDAYEGALYSYGLAVRLCTLSEQEIHRHVSNPQYAARIALYSSHLADLSGMRQIAEADQDFLLASAATGAEKTRLMRAALDNYNRAMVEVERNVLEHYTEDVVVSHPDFLPGYNDRLKLLKLPENQVTPAYDRATAVIQKVRSELGINLRWEQYKDERADYGQIIARCRTRIAPLQKALDAK